MTRLKNKIKKIGTSFKIFELKKGKSYTITILPPFPFPIYNQIERIKYDRKY